MERMSIRDIVEKISNHVLMGIVFIVLLLLFADLLLAADRFNLKLERETNITLALAYIAGR